MFRFWHATIGLFPDKCHPILPDGPLRDMPTCVRNGVDAQCHLLVDVCFSSLSFCVAAGYFTEAVTFVRLVIRRARQFSLWRRVDFNAQI